jgi:hypothetical protein
MEKSDEQKKMDEILKQLEEEQMRLHPEMYNKPTNNEVVNN